MTNHWVDLKNTDCALIMGSNAAENHPMSFKWLLQARDTRGAKILNVDPRFTRTSQVSDLYAPIRPGTDIVFLGGMVNYALENNLYFREYVAEYTNGSFIISSQYGFSDGLFAGYDEVKRAYDKTKWAYELDGKGVPRRDKTLSHPRCAFQLLKKHYERYDADTVSRITGCPKDKFLDIAAAFCATGAKNKTGTILYAMGTTQHTVGTQNVRAFSVLQMLLGNIGRPGGGINALRGESNVQGSTDAALLYHLLPGYLAVPTSDTPALAGWLDKITPKTNDADSVNYWKNTPKFAVSLLKAWYGDAATAGNEFGFCWLPKPQAGKNYSHISMFEDMYAGKLKGLILLGQNPAVAGPNAGKERKALAKLDWMVAVDLWETDTSVFWKAPGVDPKDISTEVFLLPAAASVEKEGSISNSGRWMQWRYAAAPPPGEARTDAAVLDLILTKLKSLYAGSTDPKDQGLLNLTWNYGSGHEPDPHLVAKEINGYDLSTGKMLANFTKLLDNGTTSCGNWLYSGSYTEDGNMAARRDPSDPSSLGLFPKWSWCWPVNRRIIYNRCSCDPSGQPWDPDRAPFRYDASTQAWVSYDVPDFVATVPPQKSAASPFIMRVEGVACMFGNTLNEGPFPEHYEPYESPLTNVMSGQQINPVVQFWGEADNARGTPEQFPYIATTYRVTEHWQAGAMTRNLPWLAELMPEVFVELSPQLAQEKGISNGDTVKLVSARGEIDVKACVTPRFQPFQIDGKTYHVVGMPWHFGFNGYVTGGPSKDKSYAANQLTAHIGDGNTTIPEYKVFLCDVRKVT